MSDNIITGSMPTGPFRLVTGADVTVTNKDFAVEVATGGANRVLNLPNIDACRNRWFMLKVAAGSANNVTVTPAVDVPAQTIDGAATLVMNLTAKSRRTILIYAPRTGVDWKIGPADVVPDA